MKNKIYLTQEGKEEIEAIIKELEKENKKDSLFKRLYSLAIGKGIVETYKEILKNSQVLPVLEDYEELAKNTQDLTYSSVIYPNGVIIKQ